MRTRATKLRSKRLFEIVDRDCSRAETFDEGCRRCLCVRGRVRSRVRGWVSASVGLGPFSLSALRRICGVGARACVKQKRTCHGARATVVVSTSGLHWSCSPAFSTSNDTDCSAVSLRLRDGSVLFIAPKDRGACREVTLRRRRSGGQACRAGSRAACQNAKHDDHARARWQIPTCLSDLRRLARKFAQPPLPRGCIGHEATATWSPPTAWAGGM